jgi:hypothetical protein
LVRAGVVALCALVLATVGAVGCGEEEGVADDGVVTAYVEAPLCQRGQVAVVQNESGDGVSMKLVCLPAARGPELGQGVGGGREVDLATAGANARRATEDSTTIVYIEADDPGVSRSTHPILEAAGIGWLTAASQREAINRLSELIFEADLDSLRADVREELGQP